MGKIKNLTGQRFGKLVAIEIVGKDKTGCKMWRCLCDCGNETVVRSSNLTLGRNKSCGCQVGKYKQENLAGRRFGKSTVIGNVGTNKRQESLWECKCDCGNTFVTTYNKLNSGHTKSCGCLLKEAVSEHIDLIGKRFGRLTVIQHLEMKERETPEKAWRCKCDCGNEKDVTTSNLVGGAVVSCGCYLSETSAIRAKEQFTKHGMRHTRLYNIWTSMKERCYLKTYEEYKNYGGRGITVCDEWLHDFQSFYDWSMANGYRNDLTIDRIDVNGNYEPSNCRWADWETQHYNKRNTIRINVNGELKTLKEISREYGISQKTLMSRYGRYKKGLFALEDMTRPVKKNGRKRKCGEESNKV